MLCPAQDPGPYLEEDGRNRRIPEGVRKELADDEEVGSVAHERCNVTDWHTTTETETESERSESESDGGLEQRRELSLSKLIV